MYKTYDILFSVGQRDNYTFTPGSNTYLMQTQVQALNPEQARAMVEAQFGGDQSCSVNRVQLKF